jgi:hypothetical protein
MCHRQVAGQDVGSCPDMSPDSTLISTLTIFLAVLIAPNSASPVNQDAGRVNAASTSRHKHPSMTPKPLALFLVGSDASPIFICMEIRGCIISQSRQRLRNSRLSSYKNEVKQSFDCDCCGTVPESTADSKPCV